MKLQVLTFIAECDRVRKLLRSCKTRSRILQREDFHIECPAFSLSSAPWAGIILKKVTISLGLSAHKKMFPQTQCCSGKRECAVGLQPFPRFRLKQ